MGQAVLTSVLAFAIAVVLTATVAAATSAVKRSSRAIKLIAIAAAIALALIELQRAEPRINFTGSMPIGIYLLSPLPPHGVKPGMLVASCAPTRAARLGSQRGYLAMGPCAEDTELLLKSVAGVTGADVRVTAAGVAINGCLLPHSRPQQRDISGRSLTAWPAGHYRLHARQVWLYAADDRSWDSRYWGPVSVDAIVFGAAALLVFPTKIRSAKTLEQRVMIRDDSRLNGLLLGKNCSRKSGNIATSVVGLRAR